jgi:glycosyltransferase involved in cell wall biosynthesis
MTVLEAMSRSVPAIAPKTGGLPEIITDGIDGFLIPPENAIEYAKKCLLLYGDSEMRKRMGIEARKKIVDSFSIQSCEKKYCTLYERLQAL